jgi:hypothetical protein
MRELGVSFSGESTTLHIMQGRAHGMLLNMAVGMDQYTLCGRLVSRNIDIFQPSEATCRDCKRRWQLAQSRFVNGNVSRPRSTSRVAAPARSNNLPIATTTDNLAREAGAVAIWVVTANVSTQNQQALFSGWNSLAESERESYRRMARACIKAVEHIKMKP